MMWNVTVTLEYNATHFNVWGHTGPGNPNSQLNDALMVVVSQKLGRRSTVPPSLEPETCGVRIHYAIRASVYHIYASIVPIHIHPHLYVHIHTHYR